MGREGLSRLTVEVPEELHRRAKVRAAELGTEIRQLVIEGLEMRLEKSRRDARIRPTKRGKAALVGLVFALTAVSGLAQAKKRPVATPTLIAKPTVAAIPDGTSAYERMIAKEERDWAAWEQCEKRRMGEIADATKRDMDRTVADIQRAFRTGRSSDIHDHSTPDPPACDDKATWQADVMWLTVNTPPAGVKPYSLEVSPEEEEAAKEKEKARINEQCSGWTSGVLLETKQKLLQSVDRPWNDTDKRRFIAKKAAPAPTTTATPALSAGQREAWEEMQRKLATPTPTPASPKPEKREEGD